MSLGHSDEILRKRVFAYPGLRTDVSLVLVLSDPYVNKKNSTRRCPVKGLGSVKVLFVVNL